MNYKFISLGLNPIFQQKQNPFAAAAAIGAVGGLGTSLLNYYSQQSANKSNEWNVAQTNEMNERLFHEQLQWNEEMTQKYGTPEAQIKSQAAAYEALGLNPNIMFSHGGTSGSVPASVNPPKMEAAQAVAPQFTDPRLGEYFNQAALSKAQAENLQASTDAQNIKNRYAVTKELLDIQEQLSRKDLNDESRKQLELRSKMLEIELKYQDDFMQSRNETQKQEAALKRNQAYTEYYKGQYQKQVSDSFPELNRLQSNLLANQSFAAYMSGVNSGASAALSNEMKRHEAIKAIGTAIDNGIKANQFKLSDFGLSEAELNDMRNKGIIYRKKNSPIFDAVDGFVDYLTSIPGGVLRHLGK